MSRNFALRITVGCWDLLGSLLLAGFDWLARCHEAARQRRALGAMDDDQLKDLGLSRADIEDEIGRPFWRV
ncbi:DUF1127 domain-containing protein [Dongia soli]|uniref:DUF1127 domain-containing protein n=1 Tax=Dongia soli TaxID=600628 RepID=A0ABU5EGV9_9PROT|nr:DUF1127 domain-containing protein [Dongia soli]MDY0884658.1 DUF1127 domain-containing protein [Dongia soli]